MSLESKYSSPINIHVEFGLKDNYETIYNNVYNIWIEKELPCSFEICELCY